ncbi:helix-turn-helix domain-containing protein [Streptomyces sp. P01-B04]|uniref:PucR family transcriptional regulator n=1 Tax=Streptomyces poriferorum TaxID=2798799 RepID=UPI001C5F020E|nr:helix-turn-helix domain-containing protein [Streptomyces poriferorum]MBW5251048.1 helix-turn-helix domain-containing protein [Streptomyces poriferorum]
MPRPDPEQPAANAAHLHAATLKRLEQSSGRLAANAIARMDESLSWYRAMPPENRSWIGLVAQAGIAAFTEWFRHPETPQADEGAVSRAAALGWNSPEHVCVLLGTAPDGDSELTVEAIRRAARHAKLQVLTGVLGNRLVVIAGGSDNPLQVAKALIGPYAAGPVVAGPVVPDLGLKACGAWQDAPRPVLADDLLPERAMAGDPAARDQLVEEIYRPLEEAGSALLETLSVYLEQASSLEGAARMLFVHPNTVRYRLRRVTDVTGWSPSDVRSAFTLRIALILGRLADRDLQS